MKIKILSIVNSFVPLYPIIGVILYMSSAAFQHGQFPMTDSGTIATFLWLSYIISFLLSSFLAVYFYFKLKKIGMDNRALLLFSGLISYPVSLILKEKKIKRKIGVKHEKYRLIFLISIPLTAAVVATPLLVLGAENVYDKPFYNHKHDAPTFSTDPSNPNYIELFTDGLDWNYFSKSISNNHKDYSDFTFYPQFVSGGFVTSTGFLEMFRGEHYWKKSLHGNEEFLEKFTGKYGAQLGPTQEQLNLYSTLGPTTYDTYPHSWTSSEDLVDMYLPNVNYVNGEMANVIENKPLGAYAPAFGPYKAFSDTAKLGKSSYTLFMDHIAHIPVYTDLTGRVSPFISIQKSYDEVNKTILMLENKLKALSDNQNRNAWDNTSIIVYGDHASHHWSHPTEGHNFEGYSHRKNQSLLLVKPLKKYVDPINMDKTLKLDEYENEASQPSLKISNREISGAFLQKIGDTIKQGDNPIQFIDNNPNFDLGRIFSTRFTKYNNTSYLLTKFDQNGILKGVDDNEIKTRFNVTDVKNSNVSRSDYKGIIEEELAWK